MANDKSKSKASEQFEPKPFVLDPAGLSPAPGPQTEFFNRPIGFTSEQMACRAVAELTGQLADLAESITHTHAAPDERTHLQNVIREAGIVARNAFKSQLIWGGYHIESVSARKQIEVLMISLAKLDSLLAKPSQPTDTKINVAENI